MAQYTFFSNDIHKVIYQDKEILHIILGHKTLKIISNTQ